MLHLVIMSLRHAFMGHFLINNQRVYGDQGLKQKKILSLNLFGVWVNGRGHIRKQKNKQTKLQSQERSAILLHLTTIW